jgi:hypothetical protein
VAILGLDWHWDLSWMDGDVLWLRDLLLERKFLMHESSLIGTTLILGVMICHRKASGTWEST